MSSYVDFYIHSNNQFISLDDFSRSTAIYQAMTDLSLVPYEKVRQVSPEDLRRAADAILGKIDSMKDSIFHYKQMIKHVQACVGTELQERLDTIREYENYIDEIQDEIKCYQAEEMTLRVFANIAANLSYYGNAIYVGKDISDPTVADVIG